MKKKSEHEKYECESETKVKVKMEIEKRDDFTLSAVLHSPSKMLPQS